MYIVKREKQGMTGLMCRETSAADLKTLGSDLAQKIVRQLSEKEAYPKELAKKLKVHEQKVYYHIKKLEKACILKKSKTENISGVLANYYALAFPAFALTFKEFRPLKICTIQEDNKFFYPFIENGQLNCIIIAGSPVSHGKNHARAHDAEATTELALLLGSHLSDTPNPKRIMLDTQIKQKDLKNNLILIGGPAVNHIVANINKHLPIRFIVKSKRIFSTCSGKKYVHNETGIIVKIQNPFEKTKQILVLAGNTLIGTQACITALYKYLEELSYGNRYKPRIQANVVEGIDMDSDDTIDDIKILE